MLRREVFCRCLGVGDVWDLCYVCGEGLRSLVGG